MSAPATLGELLSALSRGGGPAYDLLATLDGRFDLVLLGRLEGLARRQQSSSAEILRAAIDDFVARAGDEDWATLIARLEQAEAPGVACVELMLRRHLAALGA